MESRNMAVIGVSRDPNKAGGNELLKAMRDTGYQGRVAGVNPHGGDFNGITLYRSMDDIPFDVDLGVLFIPPRAVPKALTDCARKGCKGVVITSEGFAESGDEGKQLQEEIRTILKSTGMRGFGPNTLGIVNTETGLSSSRGANVRILRPGSIGFVTQSGIFVGALLKYLSSIEGFKFSKGIGLGNKVDVDEIDALTYLMEDDQTKVVGMYLEDIKDGRRFLEVARKAAARKPVLLLKGGRTPSGAQACATHTASLAVDDSVLEGAMRQAGILRLHAVDELLRTIIGFEYMPLPKGKSVAIVTFSGAQAIMSVDAVTEQNLQMAELTDETRDRISQIVGSPPKTRNPVDLFPDITVHGFEKTTRHLLQALLDDDGVNGIIYILQCPEKAEPFMPMIEIIEKQREKPLFVSLLGNKDHIDAATDLLIEHRIPVYPFPEMGVRVFASMHRYAQRLKEKEI
jgi:acetyltransferase